MALKPGDSQATIAQNTAELERQGRPPKLAESAALDEARRTAPGSLPHHGRGRAGHQVMRRGGDA